MAFYQSKELTERRPALNPRSASEVVSVRAEFDLSAVLALNDLIEMAILPANCVPVDFVLDCDDISTAADVTLDVGVMAGTVGDTTPGNRTTGAEVFAASTVGQAGGLVRPTLKTATRIAPATVDRAIGIKVAAAATATATGKIGLTMFYRSARYGG